jgi:hypothetical protein
MSTTTIYARVPEELKSATDVYAAEHGMTLANAVTDLLGRGIEASVNEESVKALETRARDAVYERLPQVLGTCKCGRPLTGDDFLIKGICPDCKLGLSGALSGASRDGAKVNRVDLTPFLAGVGIALAVILLAYGAGK